MSTISYVFRDEYDYIETLLREFDRFPQYRNYFFSYPDEQKE